MRGRMATPICQTLFFLRGYDLLRAGGALASCNQHDSPGRHAKSGLRSLLAKGATITGHSSPAPGRRCAVVVCWCT